MRIKNQYEFTGLRLYESKDKTFIDESWADIGEWTEPQVVPSGQKIVGFQCDTVSSEFYLINLSFLLGSVNTTEITG